MWTAAALLVAGALPPAAPAHAAPHTCHGVRATIVGTDGDDVLSGTGGRDVIDGLKGDDRISGLDGRDVICGGQGADEIDGGAGRDRLYGGLDRVEGGQTPYHRGDTLVGGPGDDVLDGGYDSRGPDGGGDTISYADAARRVFVDLARGTARGRGHDTIRLRDGRVVLTDHDDGFLGGPADDEVLAGGGADSVTTRAGDDVVWLDESDAVADDRVVTGDGRDVVHGLGGADVVHTGDGRDAVDLVGDVGDLVVRLDDGRDTASVGLSGGDGHRLIGGDGEDRLALEVLVGGQASVRLGLRVLFVGGSARLPGIEEHHLLGVTYDVTGTEGADRVVVDRPSVFTALGGDDVFGGSTGDDTFDGGDGTDTYLADPGGSNTCESVESDPAGACGP